MEQTAAFSECPWLSSRWRGSRWFAGSNMDSGVTARGHMGMGITILSITAWSTSIGQRVYTYIYCFGIDKSHTTRLVHDYRQRGLSTLMNRRSDGMSVKRPCDPPRHKSRCETSGAGEDGEVVRPTSLARLVTRVSHPPRSAREPHFHHNHTHTTNTPGRNRRALRAETLQLRLHLQLPRKQHRCRRRRNGRAERKGGGAEQEMERRHR